MPVNNVLIALVANALGVSNGFTALLSVCARVAPVNGETEIEVAQDTMLVANLPITVLVPPYQ